VFVTHDQEEALEVSDKIVILNKGKIEQIGTPEDVYDNPSNPFVYGFLGNVNLFHARLDKGRLNLENHADELGDSEVSFFVRPNDVTINLDNTDNKGIAAHIVSYRILGSRVRVELKTLSGEKEIEADIDKKQWNIIKQENREKVFIIFSEAKIFSKDSTWSNYVI
jgi:sulfate transport system ATP-binding protein